VCRYPSVSRSLLLLTRPISRSLLTRACRYPSVSRSLLLLTMPISRSLLTHVRAGILVSVGLFCSLLGLFLGVS
jgi:hypothetical protein